MEDRKPIGRKNYGSIPHLPDSRIGTGDHKCSKGQARIATEKCRDKNDEVIVQEKLDGSNVGIARVEDSIFPLTRAGYIAISSPYEQHKHFHNWVYENTERFLNVLSDGERLVCEWLMQAHSTRYKLRHEPFVAFDIMIKDKRMIYSDFVDRVGGKFTMPALLHKGSAISIKDVMRILGKYGFHGALDEVEGAVWRVERDLKTGRAVDYLVKYVRPNKEDGIFLPEISKKEPVWNWYPSKRG